MKSIPGLLVFLLVVAVLGFTPDEENRRKTAKMMHHCVNVTKADRASIEIMVVDEVFDDDELMENMCFFKCALQLIGGMDRKTGQFDERVLNRGLNTTQQQVVKKCRKKADDMPTLCEKAYTLYRCCAESHRLTP